MVTMIFSVLLLILSSVWCETVPGNVSYHGGLPDIILTGSGYLSTNVLIFEQCYRLCLYTHQCKSVNWFAKSRTCELNSDIVTNNAVINTRGALYATADVTSSDKKHGCIPNPCPGSDICIPIIETSRYLCSEPLVSTPTQTTTAAVTLTSTASAATTSSITATTSSTSTTTTATTTPTTATSSTTTTTPTTTTTTSTTTTTPTTTAILTLWVDSVVGFSSQWKDDKYSANQIIGESNVYPNHGDIGEAWAPSGYTGIEWIEVKIATPVYINKIDIYETYNAGGVKKVSIRNPTTGALTVIWQTASVTVIQQSRIFSPPFTIPSYKADEIRIETDASLANDWVELDAVKVTGWV